MVQKVWELRILDYFYDFGKQFSIQVEISVLFQ